MRVLRQEIRTGVLVIVTVGVLIFILLLLGGAGCVQPVEHVSHLFR